ncbi:glycosyltransferase, partial [bacterium]|nr:glycosyltransferase [bacterium]
VLSISHCVAVGARARGAHLVYALSPMRYAWDGFDDYASEAGSLGPLAPLARLLGGKLRQRLQRWDRTAGSPARVRAVACISEHVRARVLEAWERDARVVYPPVDTETFARAGLAVSPGERFLALGAVRPNKRLDLVVSAFRELALPLDVIGPGSPRALERLQRKGGPLVSVLGEVPRDEVVRQVASARALVHAASEDFGIAPVEALAAGRPVIAFARSGVRESVAPAGEPEAGVLFEEPTSASLVAAVRRFLALSERGDLPDAALLRERAERFSRERFRENFSRFLRVEGGEAFARSLAPEGQEVNRAVAVVPRQAPRGALEVQGERGGASPRESC